MKKIKVFIDFDSTLFDRSTFKKALFEIIRQAGFSDDELEKSYRTVYGEYDYTPWKHLEALKKIKRFNESVLVKKIDKLFASAKKLLFPDSLAFLKNIDRSKFEINLITQGNKKFQKEKVKSSGIEDLFDNIYYITEEKWHYLKRLVDRFEKFFLIDDREDTTDEVAKKFPEAITIELNRKGVRKSTGLRNKIITKSLSQTEKFI